MTFQVRWPPESWPGVAPAAVESLANCTNESVAADIELRRASGILVTKRTTTGENSGLSTMKNPRRRSPAKD